MTDTLYLVRHGEDYIALEDSQEHLTDTGIHQAEVAGTLLRDEGLDSSTVVLTSTAPRAIETADIIARALGTEAVPDEDIFAAMRTPRRTEVAEDLTGFVMGLEVKHHMPPEEVGKVVLVAHEQLLSEVTHRIHVKHGEVIEWHPEEPLPPQEEPIVTLHEPRKSLLHRFRHSKV